MAGVLFGAGACSSSSDGGAAPQAGTERGACYPNGTCNLGLTCATPSNVCVKTSTSCTHGAACSCPSGSPGQQVCTTTGTICQCEGTPGSGGVTGLGGTAGIGGVLGGGGILGSGGILGTGGFAAGGIPNGGAGGAGGVSATGGNQGCGDTMSDPMNCGACGHACRSPVAGACANGQCVPYWGTCFRRQEFNSCAEYCTSVGETCAEGQCTLQTWRQWDGIDQGPCGQLYGFARGDDGANACGGALPSPELPTWLYRCCCTDTH